MKIQLNSDVHIEDTEALAAKVNTIIKIALARFEEHITHIEVHLNDSKNDQNQSVQHDYRCMLKVHQEGRQPVAVTDHAATLEKALQGATQKLEHLLDNTFGSLDERPSHKEFMSTDVAKIPRQILRLGRGKAGSKIPDSLLGELQDLNFNKDKSQ